MASVVAANFASVQESLRTLEEYAKTLDADAARRLEQLRYRTYTLERAIDITRRARQRLAAAVCTCSSMAARAKTNSSLRGNRSSRRAFT